jgi:hypothetical protein
MVQFYSSFDFASGDGSFSHSSKSFSHIAVNHFHLKKYKKFFQTVFFQSSSGGLGIFSAARFLWSNLFTDRLSQKISWGNTGTPDDEGFRYYGRSKRVYLCLRMKYPWIRDMMTGEN